MHSKYEIANTCKQTCEEKEVISKIKLKIEGSKDMTQEELEEID